MKRPQRPKGFFVDYQTHSDNAKMQSCLQNISKICVEEPYTEEYPCYPDYLKEIGPYFGIWCLFISFLGMFGNLLTMLAIPYAANRKKYVNLESCFTNISEIFLFPNQPKLTNTWITGLGCINSLDRPYSY